MIKVHQRSTTWRCGTLATLTGVMTGQPCLPSTLYISPARSYGFLRHPLIREGPVSTAGKPLHEPEDGVPNPNLIGLINDPTLGLPHTVTRPHFDGYIDSSLPCNVHSLETHVVRRGKVSFGKSAPGEMISKGGNR